MEKVAYMLRGHLLTKNKIRLIPLAIIAFLSADTLNGCVKVPEEVRNRMENYGENIQKGEANSSYCSVEDISGFDFVNIKYVPENIHFCSNTSLPEIKKLYCMNMRVKSDYEKEAENLASRVFPGLSVTFEKSTDDFGNTSMTYDSKSNKAYLSVNSTGFISFEKNKAYDVSNGGGYRVDEYLQYASGQDKQRKVVLQGKEIKLSELSQKAEKFANHIIANPNFTYHATDFYILYDNVTGDEDISINLEILYNGVSLDSVGNKWKPNEPSNYSKNITVRCHSIDEFDWFSTGLGQLDILSNSEITKVISPESALEIVDKTFSGFEPIAIERVEVYYELYQEDNQFIEFPGYEVVGKPVYAFLIRKTDVQPATDEITLKPNFYDFIYVDMQDGTVTTSIGDQ